jgi:hypothetical protein
MKPSDCTFTAQQLLLIPNRGKQWAATVMGKPGSYFDGCTGNALFAFNADFSRAQRGEWRSVPGTRIDGYFPELGVLIWQFARLWMGHPGERYALIAAPEEEVFFAFHGEICLVGSPQMLVAALPEDCNLHWRSFHQRDHGLDPLLALLRLTGVRVFEEGEDDPVGLSALEQLGVPTRRDGKPPRCGRGDSLLRIEARANGEIVARLATGFSLWYGIDMDDD